MYQLSSVGNISIPMNNSCFLLMFEIYSLVYYWKERIPSWNLVHYIVNISHLRQK